MLDGPATIIFRGERVNTTSFKSVSGAGVVTSVGSVFTNGAEKLSKIAAASTAWKTTYAKKTVEKVCYAVNRSEIEAFSGQESAITYLLKNKSGDWLFDEKLDYIGSYDVNVPMTALVKAIEDKIAELRNKTVVDLGSEFKFLTEPPYGYYNNYVCFNNLHIHRSNMWY